jgi:hypothetical protein
MYVRTFEYIHTHTHIQTHIHTYIHTYIPTYTHTQFIDPSIHEMMFGHETSHDTTKHDYISNH